MYDTEAPTLKDNERSRSNSLRERSRNKKRKYKRSASKRKDICKLKRRMSVPITPQMIYDSIQQLQTRRLYVDFSLIVKHLCRYYPIENDERILIPELREKLDCAVLAGLISRCGVNKYCLSNLREQANAHKSALSIFWEKYYQDEMLPLRKKRNTVHSSRIIPNDNEADYSSSDSSS